MLRESASADRCAIRRSRANLLRFGGSLWFYAAGHLPTAKVKPTCQTVIQFGRVVLDRQTIHLDDLSAEVDAEFPESLIVAQQPVRTMLATPLLREGCRHRSDLDSPNEVRPFSEKQIALLKTFADQRSSPSRTCACSRNSAA